MHKWLYQLQICNYDNRAMRALHGKATTGQVKFTPRVKRLRAVTILLCVLGLGLPCLCLARTVRVANTCLRPWENAINRGFVRRAKRQLAALPHLIKIGITGSYGKTSVKNILAQMLSVKYRVVASPASFNTPLGFARTVNQHLTPDTQVLIMEMGARHPGEIREMCELVKPDHGIITSIGACHLETFGDIVTVAQTKAELFASLPATGLAITDADNPWCRELKHPNLRLVTYPEPPYQTPLLGQHNQKNIALCATLARELGIDETAINQVVAQLAPTPHRLQKIVAPNGIIILDDSYNANPTSVASALAVLNQATGKKVVQTPGLVEQGTNSAAAHRELCAQIAAVADAVIVVGELNKAYFQDGLRDFQGQVFYAADREAAKKIYPHLLTSGDTLLIANDLPEQY